MKKLFFLIFVLFFQNLLYPQSGWMEQSRIPDYSLRAIDFANNNTGCAVGTGGIIIRTTNSGANWNYQIINAPQGLTGIKFINENTGFAVGAYSMFRSGNGGLNWNIHLTYPDIVVPTDIIHNIHDSSLYFVDRNSIWKSTSHGGTWYIVYNGGGNIQALKKVFFTSATTGFCVGGKGVTNGVVLKTTNGGVNWSEKSPADLSRFLYSSYFINNYTGYVVGLSNNFKGMLYKTTDGAESWTKLVDTLTGGAVDCSFTNESTGYLIASSNKIYKTTDAGLNFNIQIIPFSSEGFSQIKFIDEHTGYVVGTPGLIMKTTSGGTTFINYFGEIPLKFGLDQNFPNPFNPSTSINFQVPKKSLVVLKVFDLTGREIQTLVNESMKMGTYSVNFNAYNLSSGVYFYRLSTDEFVLSRKMTLIK